MSFVSAFIWPQSDSKVRPDGIVEVCDKMTGARLLIACQKPDHAGGLNESEPIWSHGHPPITVRKNLGFSLLEGSECSACAWNSC
jgi:hypothetical protein